MVLNPEIRWSCQVVKVCLAAKAAPSTIGFGLHVLRTFFSLELLCKIANFYYLIDPVR